MQSTTYLIITFVVITSAKQLKLGPQLFTKPQSASPSSQQQNKRYVTQDYTTYFTPDEIKELQSFKTFENPQRSQSSEQIQQDQSEGEQIKWYKSQLLSSVLGAYGANYENFNSELNSPRGNFEYTNSYPERNPQENRDVVTSLIEKANNYENNNGWRQHVQEDNTKPENDYESAYDIAEKAKQFGNYYWQRPQNDESKQESDLRNDSILKSYRTVSTKNQDNNLLNNKLKQQWNRILDHNRAQLKSIQSGTTEPQEPKQAENSAEKIQSRSKIADEIDNILKNHRDFQLSQQSDNSEEEQLNQRPPILIHKEVSVTKHLPVPFVKKVKVSVPTPVLVPVPEPFEVKNPRLESVPIQILRYLSSER